MFFFKRASDKLHNFFHIIEKIHFSSDIDEEFRERSLSMAHTGSDDILTGYEIFSEICLGYEIFCENFIGV